MNHQQFAQRLFRIEKSLLPMGCTWSDYFQVALEHRQEIVRDKLPWRCDHSLGLHGNKLLDLHRPQSSDLQLQLRPA